MQIHSSYTPSHEIGMTMAYVAIGWTSIINILNVRSFNKSIFKIGLFSNLLLFCGMCFSLVLVFATAVLPLGLSGNIPVNIFYCAPMSLNHWLILTGLAISPLVVIELQKLFIRRKAMKANAGNYKIKPTL